MTLYYKTQNHLMNTLFQYQECYQINQIDAKKSNRIIKFA